ncbi:MAG: flotillin domain-containing protein [Pseudomonadota bacterium]
MAGSIIIWIIGIIIAIIIAVWLLNWLYFRTTKERAFVRTGMGGEKVVINSGAFVIPVIHEITPVNLSLARLSVAAAKEEALITADRMRVDVDAEFFVRVEPTDTAVSSAAATLGRMTTSADELSAFFAGEFLAALRSAASEQSMTDIHQNRAGYVARVREIASAAVSKSGLTLDTVAIRNLDQTALEYFNPANSFDAEGLTQLIELVEDRRKQRNDIEQRAIVAIREANLAAEKETLQLDRESELARLAKEQDVERSRAAQKASISREQAEKDAEAESARITARQATNQQEIAAKEEVERARIASDRALDESRVLRDQELRTLEISRQQVVEMAEIEKEIKVLQKSASEADERIKTGERLADAAKAEEGIATARETESARRSAEISKIMSEKDAAAEQLRAAVAAEAEKIMNEADNMLSEEARLGRLRKALIDKLEVIIRESVKPIEKIDGIKVVHMGGMGGDGGGGRTPTDEVIDSALRYRVQAPLIDELMKEVGVEGSVSKMGDVFRAARDAQSIAEKAEKDKKDG